MSVSIRRVTPKSPEFAEVQDLRTRYIGNNPAGEANFAHAESLRDLCSYHMVYMDQGRLVGAMRMTPMGHGLSFAERVLDIRPYFARPVEAFDANRLVLDPTYRGGHHLRDFLLKTAVWMLANTSFKSISALCRGPLAGIYVGIGGQVLADGILWQPQLTTDNTDTEGSTAEAARQYSLIALELETVYDTIKRRMDNGTVFQRAG